MDSRRHPGGNVTGVYEKLHLLRSLRVLHDILPSATKVVGLFDESPTGLAVAEQVYGNTSWPCWPAHKTTNPTPHA